MSFKITEDCISCGTCVDECAISAINETDSVYIIDQEFCTECGACMYVCDYSAIVEKTAV